MRELLVQAKSDGFPVFLDDPDAQRYLSDDYLVLDFETEVNDDRYGSSIDERNHLALSCFCDSTGRVVHHWGSEFNQLALVEAVKQTGFIVAHNVKYELGWLNRCGVDTSKLLCFDTMLAEYVLLGNLASIDTDSGVRRRGISLDDCCARRHYPAKDPIVDLWMEHGVKVSEMPRKWVEDRCKQDVATTRRLFLDQRNRLARSNRLGVLYTRCTFTPVLSAIENEGIHLDKDRVASTVSEYRGRLNELEKRFAEFTGGINFRSSKQVAAFLYDELGFSELTFHGGKPRRTPTGNRLANAKVLDKLRATTERQREFLALRKDIGKVAAALSKNLNYFEEVCEKKKGHFYAEFNQAITATHRISSTGIKSVESKFSCQLTNIPRAFKRLITTRRPGYLIGEADGSQLEFRVAAFLGNDKQAKADIANPEWDAHLVTAAAMMERPIEELRNAYLAGEKWASEARQLAKPETFKPLYGGSKGTPAQERWYAEFKRRYPDLARVQEDWVYEVLATKRLTTQWGMRWYFPHAKMSDTGYCNVGSTVYNYPVQSLATAEIIPIALSYFWRTIKSESLEDYIVPINTVHDSIVCEIHPDHTDDFRRIARASFGPCVYNYLATVYGLEFDVPLGVGLKIGTHWSEGQEEKYEFLSTESK